jgi:hypothetical protein
LAAASSAAASSVDRSDDTPRVAGIEDSILVDDASIDVEKALSKIVGSDKAGRDEEWAEEDAARMRESELATLSESVLRKLSVVDASDGKESHEAALEAFGSLLEDDKDTLSNEDISREAEGRGIDRTLTVVACVQVLLNRQKPAETLATLKKRVPLFRDLVGASDEAAKYLLGSIDRLMTVGAPHLLAPESKACLPAILQTLYDQDVVTEAQLRAWSLKSNKRFVSRADGLRVREAATPFFEWLASADSDSEDESE